MKAKEAFALAVESWTVSLLVWPKFVLLLLEKFYNCVLRGFFQEGWREML